MADKMTKTQLDKWLKELYDRNFLDKFMEHQILAALKRIK